MFLFHGNILNFPTNENARKQHLSANAYSCLNMKFLHAIAASKDDIFCNDMSCYNENKQFLTIIAFRSNFCWQHLSEKMKISPSHFSENRIDKFFVEDIYIFTIISCTKFERRINDFFFVFLHGNKSSLICSNQLRYWISLVYISFFLTEISIT